MAFKRTRINIKWCEFFKASCLIWQIFNIKLLVLYWKKSMTNPLSAVSFIVFFVCFEAVLFQGNIMALLHHNLSLKVQNALSNKIESNFFHFSISLISKICLCQRGERLYNSRHSIRFNRKIL